MYRHRVYSLFSLFSCFCRRYQLKHNSRTTKDILKRKMASLVMNLSFCKGSIERKKLRNEYGSRPIISMKVDKPLEELYNVRVERSVPKQRLMELGVSKWSMWKTGKCQLPWDWHVDQFVYIEEGEVRVVPEGSQQYMRFIAGDLVRYPKWFEADLFFNDFYQERYSFRAYGDD